ncbi:MAG: hypothetical protein ACD_81C00040G0006 [uncultured bacterium]|uniref:Uncharacterized protein n=1 Tax=Candidatus Wolfebacteria bacterium GW2011_GWE2_44_13 TaxID=1619017 RepID=A0A0G1K7T5_9BACT|nr:MAG: hypothetical protein ACD_81C00040G0006 [uncultured bacterium]KKT43939.1 MAG: hypothetical protein UW32_C0001G0531 [Candidatus Wolfebacteria bacterium GW2011_GWE2_44_13]
MVRWNCTKSIKLADVIKFIRAKYLALKGADTFKSLLEAKGGWQPQK